MKNILKIGCIALLSLVSMHVLWAQEEIELRDLQINASLKNAQKIPKRKSINSLPLPFFDDFSTLQSPFPNPNFWQDNSTFINANFPLFPPSIGVATFDALNSDGWLYGHASTYSFAADTLTSQPIRLDSIFQPIARLLTPSDSIYLSFYYQPGGGFGDTWMASRRGRAPKNGDKLILEFFDGNAQQWQEVWSTNGEDLEDFCPLCATDTADSLKTFFKQVFIPIDTTSYLYDGFRFRFRNLSSLDADWQNAGGQWHVDYVYLNYNRTMNDPFSNDIAFVEPGQRVFRDFHVMPFKQFRGEADLTDVLPLVFRNLDDEADVVTYYSRIIDAESEETVWNTTPSEANVYPFHTHGFNSVSDISKPPLQYRFPNITKPETFNIYHVLKKTNSAKIYENNDTMMQTVHFGNFYAYDDGTAEAGFGLNSVNGQLAYRFPMETPDTLAAIQIHFNHSLADMRGAYFKLMVWRAENDSTPSETPIYVGSTDELPIYDETIGYHTYVLDAPLVLQKGLFFIGLQQKTSTFLNIGFDQNSNAENRMFYYNQGAREWFPVFYYGSLMMNPIFGTSQPSGICEDEIVSGSENIQIYPNPCQETVFVESSETLVKSYEIYDLSGRRLAQKKCSSKQFSVQMPQQSGVYILMLYTENGVVAKKVARQ